MAQGGSGGPKVGLKGVGGSWQGIPPSPQPPHIAKHRSDLDKATSSNVIPLSFERAILHCQAKETVRSQTSLVEQERDDSRPMSLSSLRSVAVSTPVDRELLSRRVPAVWTL